MGKKSHQGLSESLSDLMADPILWMVMKADKIGEAELIELITATMRRQEAGTAPEKSKPTAYRPGVGIMLLNQSDEVLVGCRRDILEQAWQMPQGGIDEGEDPRQAAFRELKEEIGTNDAEILTESDRWLFYDLPDELIGKAWHGRWRGQRQKWFVMRFKGRDEDIAVKTHHSEFSAWKWVALRDLPDLIVSFKRPLYLELLDEFSNVLHKRGG